MTATPALGAINLITGPEEFLGERAVSAVRRQVKTADPEAEFGETTADQLTMATLGDLAAPSLFSSTRCVVVRRLEDLPEESVAGLLDYAAAPADDVALVLVHSGGQKGSGLLTKLRKLASVTEHKSATLKASEFVGFVTNELRAHQVRIDAEAADHLVRSVGHDLRSLAAAADQLASDFAGRPIDSAMVRKYFSGRAEAKSFAIADAAIDGLAAKALEELRWALDSGTAPVLVTSAVAGSLRSLARFKTARAGLREADLAREIGAPPWKIRILRNQARGWEPDSIGRAIRAVARADADIKGHAHDPSYALEKMVLDITAARRR